MDRKLINRKNENGTDGLCLEQKLHIYTNREPIVFTYKETFDRPEDHRPHTHQHYELVYFVEGEADYIVEDDYYTLTPGDLLLIKPNNIHGPILKQPCYYKRFYMIVPNHIFAHYFVDPLAPLLRRTGDASARLLLSRKNSRRIRDILYDIVDVCREFPAESDCNEFLQTEVYAKILQLLCILSEKCTSVQIAGEHIDASSLPTPLKTVLPYIENNIAHISSVSEIAEAVHISAPYLSAVFRKHLGIPLVSYLQTRKIALAKQLLEEGHSVTHACYESGFSDCSYFIRIFKNHIGVTPLQYRNSFRNDIP